MMPMGIASFSFDLFGITRRENGVDLLQPVASGVCHPEVDIKPADESEKKDVPHRDYEHVFWGMFPVL